MKKIFFLLLLLGCSYLVHAQTDNVYISVAMPNNCTLDSNTKSFFVFITIEQPKLIRNIRV